jgi:chromosome segregation ATPase
LRLGEHSIKLLERYRQMQVEEIITKEELSQILGRDFDSFRSPHTTANNRLRKEAGRHLAPVRGVGYKMVAASDHLEIAEDRRRSAGLKMSQAIALIEAARKHPDELTREMLDKCNFLVSSYHQVRTSIRSITREVKRHKEQIDVLANQSVVHSTRASKQDAKIEGLERQLGEMRSMVEKLGLTRAA